MCFWFGLLVMPGHQLHTFMDRVFFGRSFWKLHDLIDAAFWVVGRWHRKYNHDYVSAILIAKRAYPGDDIACEAGLLHILLDDYCTYNPQMKKLLEKKAKEYYKKSRRSKKKNKYDREIKLSHELVVFFSYLKRMIKTNRDYYKFHRIM